MSLETWDRKPRAPEPPFGATVVVYRMRASAPEFLLLHRAHEGPAYEGEWAWTPPAGARQPGETIEQCASRELREEAGLAATPAPIEVDGDWAVFSAKADEDAEVVLHDSEHDRFEWVTLDLLKARCRPKRVAHAVERVAVALGA